MGGARVSSLMPFVSTSPTLTKLGVARASLVQLQGAKSVKRLEEAVRVCGCTEIAAARCELISIGCLFSMAWRSHVAVGRVCSVL